jgi:hypothetical protein
MVLLVDYGCKARSGEVTTIGLGDSQGDNIR